MIKLATLLKEIQGAPKAIFLAGPAGSGKSTLTKQLLPSSYQVINSDDTYEELLKASGIGLKQKDFTPDQLSQAAKLQAQARKTTQDKLAQSIESKNNIIKQCKLYCDFVQLICVLDKKTNKTVKQCKLYCDFSLVILGLLVF